MPRSARVPRRRGTTGRNAGTSAPPPRSPRPGTGTRQTPTMEATRPETAHASPLNSVLIIPSANATEPVDATARATASSGLGHWRVTAERTGAGALRPGMLFSVRSSNTRARSRVRLVRSRGASWRHTREGDVKDVRNRAGVDNLIHFARSLDERLTRGVRGGLALAADRSVSGERALLDDDDRAPWMGMPTRGAPGVDRDLRHGYVRSEPQRDAPV